MKQKNDDLAVYGKVPPQARELEDAILGACMLSESAIDILTDINFTPECFYDPINQKIFRVIQDMFRNSIPVDEMTVVQQLLKTGELKEVGGPYAITQLTVKVVSTANIEAHARIVMQKFIQRELIRISGDMMKNAYDETCEVFDLLDDSQAQIFNVTNIIATQNFYHASTVQAKALNRLDQLRKNPIKGLSGVTSGFAPMDRITHGWQPTDLIILAARPSVGKTAFALNLARNAANAGDPVGFFSLEMSAEQLIQRIWSAESEILLDRIRQGQLEEPEYAQLHKRGIQKVDTMPLYIDDSAALNVFQLRSKARKMVSKFGVKLIIIDYLQLMSGVKERNGNREQEISTISRNLKSLAKELNIPIIALSQLSRAVETRKESKIPQLSDLRESGAIEQDADMVMFIYRPEYYENFTNEMGETTKGETHIKIAKHRNGILETVKLKALLHYQKFEDWNGSDTPYISNSFPSGSTFKPIPTYEEDTPF